MSGQRCPLLAAQPKQHFSAWFKRFCNQWDQGCEIADRPHRCEIEHGGGNGGNQIFQALVTDGNLAEAADSRRLFQKGPFLGHWLQKGHEKLGEDDLKGETGESGTRSDIEEAAGQLDLLGNEQTFAKVTGDSLFRGSDRCQVDFGVPAHQQIEIIESLANLEPCQVESKRF